MSTSPLPEPGLELLHADEYQQYLLWNSREIAFVLRQLAARRATLVVHCDTGSRIMASSVVGVSGDDAIVFLDVSSDKRANARAVASDNLLCVTQMDGIKIQFQLGRLELTEFEGFPAFSVGAPDALLRLQRREYYRLSLPASDSLVCQFTLEPQTSRHVDAKVLDISGGGVAVRVPASESAFTVGARFEKCLLDLPEFGLVTVDLEVRNLVRLVGRNGVETLRVGCKFSQISSPTANAIHRYIMAVERKRKALT